MSPTSVGDGSDNPRGIAGIWAGDGSDNPREAVHAWVGDGSDDPRQVDVPTRLAVDDLSFCDTSGEFDQAVYQQRWQWDNLHFANVAHVELWVNGSEHTTEPVGASGQRQIVTDATSLSAVGGSPYDCKVRYEYSDGSHSPFSNIVTVAVDNPCG